MVITGYHQFFTTGNSSLSPTDLSPQENFRGKGGIISLSFHNKGLSVPFFLTAGGRFPKGRVLVDVALEEVGLRKRYAPPNPGQHHPLL